MAQINVPAEQHFMDRIGWLRAAVLGANDGIVSTASLIAGVASAGVGHSEILLAGTAGLAAGAMSMVAGEYVSVNSQSDTERADLEREKMELATMPDQEQQELADIYEARGLTPDLARQVSQQLMDHDALGTHARDELGIAAITQARPLQAALSSAASFTAGAAVPVAAAMAVPVQNVTLTTTLVSLLALASLGALSARTGGAPVARAVMRVTFWGGCNGSGRRDVWNNSGMTRLP